MSYLLLLNSDDVKYGNAQLLNKTWLMYFCTNEKTHLCRLNKHDFVSLIFFNIVQDRYVSYGNVYCNFLTCRI